MPKEDLKDHIQEVTLRFEDGTKAKFIGPAFATQEQMKTMRLSPQNPIQIGSPIALTDEIRKEIAKNQNLETE
jgi:hypothetical protein